MKILRSVLAVILSIAVIISPFVFVLISAISMPPCYQNTFVGALDEKVERLNSIKGEKIVIIGGSSAAFGIDSALIEKYTDMPVVNFGLYASLGTKLMLDLSRSAIGEGDIVVVAPELDRQTLSLYFNSETTLQAFDGNFSMLKGIRADNIFALLSGMWKFAADKRELIKNGIPDPDGVYNANNFNEYGDLVYKRPQNEMQFYYDPNVMIDPNPEILSSEFIDYLNDYTSYCKMRGAKVYYSFAPMNERGFVGGYDSLKLLDLADHIGSELDAAVISRATDYVYDAGYFYDTNFHLNDAGVRLHTVNLIKDILLELGIPKLVDEEIPDPPKLPFVDVIFESEDENAGFFTYERLENGGYRITGLSESGKTQRELTLPLGYNGYKVITVGKAAFSGSLLEKLVIPKNTNIRNLEALSFSGADKLSELWIYYPTEADILPPPDFTGVASGFKVHIPEGSSYDTGYYWSERNLIFIKDAD